MDEPNARPEIATRVWILDEFIPSNGAARIRGISLHNEQVTIEVKIRGGKSEFHTRKLIRCMIAGLISLSEII